VAARQLGRQEIRSRLGADENEQARSVLADNVSVLVAQTNGTDGFRAPNGGYLRMVANLDLRICPHPIAEIRGHALAQVTASHYKRNFSRVLRKEHRRLPG